MNKTFKYIVLLALACFVGKANAQELKTEVFSLLNLDYPGLEKVKALHQEGKTCQGRSEHNHRFEVETDEGRKGASNLDKVQGL